MCYYSILVVIFENRNAVILQFLQVPNIAYYIPDFLTKEDEDLLLLKIYQVPKPKWTYLSNRRLQNWGV